MPMRVLTTPDTPIPEVQLLSDPRYWGGPITDERYVLVTEL